MAVQTATTSYTDLRIDVKSLLDYQQFVLDEKVVTYPAPLSEQQLVDRSFADYALQHATPR